MVQTGRHKDATCWQASVILISISIFIVGTIYFSMPILYLTILRKLTENCKKSVSSCAHRFARDSRRLADFWTIITGLLKSYIPQLRPAAFGGQRRRERAWRGRWPRHALSLLGVGWGTH